MTTKETVEQYFDRLKRKDGWQASLSDDLVFDSYTSPIKHVTGKQAYLQTTNGFYSSIRQMEVRDLITEGDKAVALTHYDLAPAPGKEIATDVAEVFRVRNGQIDSLAIYFDTAPFPK
jgi:ketosteroid isomerase-like protein